MMSDAPSVLEEFIPFYYHDSVKQTGLTVLYPQEVDEYDESLAEWQFIEAHQYNCWVDRVCVNLFLENYVPAVELPYSYDRQRKALVVIYEKLENEYSLSSVRRSYNSPERWIQLDYEQEGFYPPVPLNESNFDYKFYQDASKNHKLDNYGFLDDDWLLLWDRHFDIWEDWMM